MDSIISLPVSLGESIDKLTILHIKCDKITDRRKIDVQKEYDILYENLKGFIVKFDELYCSMKKINLIIWHQMDVLRDGNTSDEDYMKLCRKCIESNDIRFRIKNKINLISNSALKEQKSYKVNRLVIQLNCHEQCFDLFIEPIKYFSYIYDEIIIQSSNNIVDKIKECFDYDNTIKYNIELNGLDIKQEFNFQNDCYTINEIYKIMNITEQHLQML
jgi:hypothetical protein